MHRARHSEASRAVRPRLVVALVVASAGLATAVWLPSRFDSAEATEGNRERSQNQSEVFADNFSGNRGSAVDRRKLVAEDRRGRLRGRRAAVLHRQHPQRAAGRRRQPGDHRPRRRTGTACGATTGAATSPRRSCGPERTFTAAAGRAEARIQVPESQGVESAFRVLGADDLAVMENLGSDSSTIRGAVGDQEKSLEADRPFSDDFHIYAVDWQPGLTVWSVDGEEFFRTEQSTAFDEPFALVLNLAVGGDRAGEPRNRDRFPQRMIVDFVKVSVTEGDEEAPPATTPPTTPPTTEPTTPPPTNRRPRRRPSRPRRPPRPRRRRRRPPRRRPPRSGSRSRSTRPASASRSTASPTRCSRRTRRCPSWEPPAVTAPVQAAVKKKCYPGVPEPVSLD